MKKTQAPTGRIASIHFEILNWWCITHTERSGYSSNHTSIDALWRREGGGGGQASSNLTYSSRTHLPPSSIPYHRISSNLHNIYNHRTARSSFENESFLKIQDFQLISSTFYVNRNSSLLKPLFPHWEYQSPKQNRSILHSEGQEAAAPHSVPLSSRGQITATLTGRC